MTRDAALGPPSAVESRRAAMLALVGLGMSAVATLLVVRDLDLARTAGLLSTAQPALLGAALALLVVQAVLRALRWQALLPRRDDGRRIPARRAAMAMLVGYLGNTVLPARLGELIRAGLIARSERISAGAALGSALLERLIDVFVLALLGLVAATAVAAPGWVRTTSVTVAIVGGTALVLLAAGAVLVARRAASPVRRPGRRDFPGRAQLARLAGALASGGRIVDRPAAVAVAGTITIATWLIDAALIWCVARSIGIDLSPGGAMLVSVVAVLSTAIPTAPGYVGTFELAAVTAVGISGVTGELALAFAILAHVVAVLPLSIAGAVSLWAMGAPSLIGLAASARAQAPARPS